MPESGPHTRQMAVTSIYGEVCVQRFRRYSEVLRWRQASKLTIWLDSPNNQWLKEVGTGRNAAGHCTLYFQIIEGTAKYVGVNSGNCS